MNSDWLNIVVEWIRLNPDWAYGLVFLTAAVESLAIIGLFLPGAVLMFAVGTLVAADALPLTETILFAAAGAVMGDGVSFWIGRHFHQQLRVVWPFKRYPALINRGVDFFTHHGGKSVLFARFIGPVRPILPAIAGMLDMPASRFFTVNIFSALLWAPAYIIPGVVFGASLGLAAEVAGRLVVVLVVLVAAVWLTAWLIHRLFNLIQPHMTGIVFRLQNWSRQHPLSEPMLGALLDPEHPEARGLAYMVTLFFTAILLFALLINASLSGIDRWVFASLSELQTPFANQLMLLITELGSAWVLGPTLAIVLSWLVLQKNWQAVWHTLFAALIAFAMTHLLKNLIQTERPLPLYNDFSQYSFPSSHTASSAAVFGFFAVMVARELSVTYRWLPYSIAALFISAIAFSRLYLGAHWLTDVMGGLTLGLGIVMLFGIAYRRHPAKRLPWRRTSVIGFAALFVSAVINEPDEQYALVALNKEQQSVMSVDEWWQSGWQALPAYRIDLADKHNHPLNIQYAGTLDELSKILIEKGWQEKPFPEWTETLRWLTDLEDPLEYPLLPQVHDGHHETMRWVYQNSDKSLYVLRLWPAFNNQSSIWVGNVSEVTPKESFGLFHFLATGSYEEASDFLHQSCNNSFTINKTPSQLIVK